VKFTKCNAGNTLGCSASPKRIADSDPFRDFDTCTRYSARFGRLNESRGHDGRFATVVAQDVRDGPCGASSDDLLPGNFDCDFTEGSSRRGAIRIAAGNCGECRASIAERFARASHAMQHGWRIITQRNPAALRGPL
jgi:hypothetical protein